MRAVVSDFDTMSKLRLWKKEDREKDGKEDEEENNESIYFNLVKDIRRTFTNQLYEVLVDVGLRTFKDDNEIERGENIKSELDKAIHQSKGRDQSLFCRKTMHLPAGALMNL
ncbi:hypothetical protein BC332_22017 [Capsicum chinense]|nr:hypothetical protein BC332_22017 [Capsicum chinense]